MNAFPSFSFLGVTHIQICIVYYIQIIVKPVVIA